MVGSVVIITVLEYYFSRWCLGLAWLFLKPCTVIAVFGIAFGYGYFAAFYRASARELKRIGKLLVVLCSPFTDELHK